MMMIDNDDDLHPSIVSDVHVKRTGWAATLRSENFGAMMIKIILLANLFALFHLAGTTVCVLFGLVNLLAHRVQNLEKCPDDIL